jgi:hypothetical protein
MIKVIVMLPKFIIAATIALFLNSCNIKTDFGNGKKGNGKIITEVRTIKQDFSSIDVESDIEVILEQSSDKFISVQAESNLQKLIDTKVENGVLIIEPNEPINATKTIKITIRMPKIEGLEASSGSIIKGIGTFKGDDISIDASSAAEVNVNLKYDNITLDSSSGSSINAKGMALKLETSASSGAEIEAYELLVNDVTADVSSGASINIHPIVNLNGNASSGGNITYNTEPKSITKDESSGGSISKM